MTEKEVNEKKEIEEFDELDELAEELLNNYKRTKLYSEDRFKEMYSFLTYICISEVMDEISRKDETLNEKVSDYDDETIKQEVIDFLMYFSEQLSLHGIL